jgi:hypothetical protein
VLFALSYDPVDVLRAFAEHHGLTYTLLSDVGSHTIKRLGLLNQYVVEQHTYYGVELKPHHQNVPYPGYFVLDEAGTVVRKRFEQSYRVRVSAEALLRDVLPLPLGEGRGEGAVATMTPPSPAATRRLLPQGEVLEARAWFAPPAYRPYQEILLNVELSIPPGLHVYGSPVPEGYTLLAIDVDPVPGLVVGAAELPNPRPFRIEGLEEQFFIYEGHLVAVVPLRIEQAPAPGPLDLTVRVHYAACSDTACLPPSSLELSILLPADDLVRA